MNRRILSLVLVLAFLPAVFLPTGKGAIYNPPGPNEYVVATIGAPSTVDPALAYEMSSGELVFNVYETLITFNKESTSSFVPTLADSWTISPDGTMYSFHIRSGVQWQDPVYGTLKPSDVEYSFERVMVRDYTGSPAWMFWEPIFGNFSADMDNPVACGKAIDAAIQSDDGAGTVTIQFAASLSYPPFQAILSQTWASVLSKNWAIAQGDWPGTGLQDGSWVAYHDPPTSPLDDPPSKMMGTGPYKLDYFISAGWSIIKHDNYWGGWGNPRRGYASRGYLTRVTELFISDWATRFAGFTGSSPIYDDIVVPGAFLSQVWQQPGVQCIYPLTIMSMHAMFFNFDTGSKSPYIGNGQWGELGIIPTFFSDEHVRKAIAYSFNWTQYIASAYMGEAKQISIPVPDTLKFHDLSPWGYATPEPYGINLASAAAEWAQAWGGLVLSKGFRFTIAYGAGAVPRLTAAQLIKNSLEAQNPKFHVDIVEVSGPTYLSDMYSSLNGGRSVLTMFYAGWLADYPDVHDFVVPFMASWGWFANPQSIDMDPRHTAIDNYIGWGFTNTTDAMRAYNYNSLYQLYHELVPSVPLVQGLSRRWARDWVKGWHYNPVYPGTYAYSIWKEELPAEDLNADGKVDIKDLAAGAKAFGSYFIQPLLPPNPAGPPGAYSRNWDSRTDINVINPSTGARGDMRVDIRDLAAMARLFGYVAPWWTPPP